MQGSTELMPVPDLVVRLRIPPRLDADVIIVGAGPAGTAAAVHLIRAGWRVLLVDRHAFPRDKVCGDFVGPVALVELRRLGLNDRPDYRSSHCIWSAALHVDGREFIARPLPAHEGLPSYGRCIPRLMLDDWLMDAARQAGAAILENVTAISYEAGHDSASVQVKSKDENRTLRARLVIGADGSSSTISRQPRGGPPPDGSRIIAARAYYEDYEGPADRADLYFAGESFPGYYRLFPRVSLVAVNSSVAERRRRWRNVAMSSGSARIGDLSLRAL